MRSGRRDPITDLRRAIDALPVRTREAMLAGIRSNPIIVGAYTDDQGGICPMLAAHRNGGRTTLLAFARSWDAFARVRAGRIRRATRRELSILESQLTASLLASDGWDLQAAIAEHEALKRRPAPAPAPDPQKDDGRDYVDIGARRLRPRRTDAERALARLDLHARASGDARAPEHGSRVRRQASPSASGRRRGRRAAEGPAARTAW